jgi:hypothetical protein
MFPATAAARRRMQHPRGREDYKMRASTVEPVFALAAKPLSPPAGPLAQGWTGKCRAVTVTAWLG